jgi:hypothetical protein
MGCQQRDDGSLEVKSGRFSRRQGAKKSKLDQVALRSRYIEQAANQKYTVTCYISQSRA